MSETLSIDVINVILANATASSFTFPHKIISSIDLQYAAYTPREVRLAYKSTPVAPYTPQDVRLAYKSTPVASLYGKKTVVVTIAIAFAFPASLLQSSLDAFCQLNNIPTTTLEVIPFGEGPVFDGYAALCKVLSDLLMTYINAPNNNGTEFNLDIFLSDYVVPWIIANISAPDRGVILFVCNSAMGALMETVLDTQWSHAMNPNAHIRVVQAIRLAPLNGMFDAVKYASDPANFANNPWGPTDIISMSWGAPDSGFSQPEIDELDASFSSNAICYLAASGDVQTILYPATSSNILGVGGTSLYFDPIMRQTTWNGPGSDGGGCGPSIHIPKPDFQVGVTALNAYNKRCSPDIAGIADPNTAVKIIYGSTSGNSMYIIIGGTSLACPVNAGMLSNLIQTSINRDGPTFTTVLNNGNSILLQKVLYDLYKNVNSLNANPNPNPDPYAYCFYDVTQGTDNGFSAGPGFDVPTGLGSPYWNNISATWFYAIPSEICFPANTPVLTDQGIVAIQNIEPGKHTLRNKRIVAVTQTVSHDDHLVHFSKHSLGYNYPTEDTRMSKHHKILYSGKMISARHFLTGFKNVTKVAYNNEFLYNVLLDEHSRMQINNLTCETLHPRSAVAKLYTNNNHNHNHNHNNQPMTASDAAVRKFRNLFIKADARQYGCNNATQVRK
jgi:subtilase family serine protease